MRVILESRHPRAHELVGVLQTLDQKLSEIVKNDESIPWQFRKDEEGRLRIWEVSHEGWIPDGYHHINLYSCAYGTNCTCSTSVVSFHKIGGRSVLKKHPDGEFYFTANLDIEPGIWLSLKNPRGNRQATLDEIVQGIVESFREPPK